MTKTKKEIDRSIAWYLNISMLDVMAFTVTVTEKHRLKDSSPKNKRFVYI